MAELNKILYAEDEMDIQSIAQMSLEMMGSYTLKVCSNGQEAIDSVESFQPDLLLFDVMMPLKDGPAAYQEIISKPGFENIPVVFMTAKVQNHEIQEYKDMGAIDVIPKPFDPMTLAQTLGDIWAKYSQ